MMKKTLVAMALVATTISGSAMAWTDNGNGGTFELGGTLTPPPAPTPWEVLVGSTLNGLDKSIQLGDKEVDIPVTTPITVLGIRTLTNQTFKGGVGMSPQIDFKGAIDTTKFSNGVTTLTLDIKNKKNVKIGQMTAPLSAAAVLSLGSPFDGQYSMNAQNRGEGFFGGLGTIPKQTVGTGAEAKALLDRINTEFTANYISQGFSSKNDFSSDFATSGSYSAAYGAGIEAGKIIKLTLDAPAEYGAINWKASLPITVSYQ